MTYFNDKIYNQNNLKPEDKRILEVMDIVVGNVLYGLKSSYDFKLKNTDRTLEKIEYETLLEGLQKVKDEYNSERKLFMVSTIDEYGEDSEIKEYPEFGSVEFNGLL